MRILVVRLAVLLLAASPAFGQSYPTPRVAGITIGANTATQLTGSGAITTGPASATSGDLPTFLPGGAIVDSGTLLTSLAPLSNPSFTGVLAVAGNSIIDATGHQILADTMRPPNAFDDLSFGYSAGDGYNGSSTAVHNFGDLWRYGGTTWQMQQNSYQQADWGIVSAGLPLDAITASAGFAYSPYKLRAAYAGNAFTLYNVTGTTLNSQAVGFVGYGPDTATADKFCGPPSTTQPCWVVPLDQSANGYNATADYGAWVVTITAGGTGYTAGATKTITMTTTGGTCSVAPVLVVNSVSSGVVNGVSIYVPSGTGIPGYGDCTATPSTAQTQASTTAGGTGFTANITWAPVWAPVWYPPNTVNGYRAFDFNSQAFQAGTYAYVVSKFLRVPSGFSYNEAVGTMAFAGMGQNAATAAQTMYTTTDGTYGANMAAGFYATIAAVAGQGNAKRCQGATGAPAMGESDPAVTIIHRNGATTYCFQNNTYTLAANNWGTTTETTAGAIISSPTNGLKYDAGAIIGFGASSISDADVNQLRISLTNLFNIQPQAKENVVIAGASMSMGRGSYWGLNPFKAAYYQLPYTVRMVNVAQSGQQLATEDAGFAGSGGDGTAYIQNARSNVWQYMGLMDDLQALCASTCTASTVAAQLSGYLKNWVYLAKTQAANYYAVTATCNGVSSTCTGATGWVSGDTATLSPASGGTCTVNPIVTIGIAVGGVPANWTIQPQNAGTCTGTATSWNVTPSGSGAGATWVPLFLHQRVPKVILGIVPLQGPVFSNASQLAVVQLLNADIAANYAGAQNGGNWSCSTTTTCGTLGQGYGADLPNNVQADPTVGPNSYLYSAFNNTLFSGDANHPTDLADSYMAGNFAAAAKQALP